MLFIIASTNVSILDLVFVSAYAEGEACVGQAVVALALGWDVIRI